MIDTKAIDDLEDEEATYCYGCDRDNSECECPRCPSCHQPMSMIEQDMGKAMCGICAEAH
jgi:hypothetical protein